MTEFKSNDDIIADTCLECIKQASYKLHIDHTPLQTLMAVLHGRRELADIAGDRATVSALAHSLSEVGWPTERISSTPAEFMGNRFEEATTAIVALLASKRNNNSPDNIRSNGLYCTRTRRAFADLLNNNQYLEFHSDITSAFRELNAAILIANRYDPDMTREQALEIIDQRDRPL